MKLDEIRYKIDKIDRELLVLLQERMGLALRSRKFKKTVAGNRAPFGMRSKASKAIPSGGSLNWRRVPFGRTRPGASTAISAAPPAGRHTGVSVASRTLPLGILPRTTAMSAWAGTRCR